MIDYSAIIFEGPKRSIATGTIKIQRVKGYLLSNSNHFYNLYIIGLNISPKAGPLENTKTITDVFKLKESYIGYIGSK